MQAIFGCISGPAAARASKRRRNLVDEVEAAIRQEIPANEFRGLLDNIGIPNSSINMTYSDSGLIGTGDADILVGLRENHRPTAQYVSRLRARLNREFPGITFYFLPADIVSQSINFGLPAPFDVQVVGRDQARNREVAARLADKIRRVDGAVDVRVQQPADMPKLRYAVDRVRASANGAHRTGRRQFGLVEFERKQRRAAFLLSEPGGRHSVRRKRPGARIPHGLAGRAQLHTDHR